MIDDCTNPAKPCHLHDPDHSWRIETGSWTIHAGWYLLVIVVAIALGSLPGMN